MSELSRNVGTQLVSENEVGWEKSHTLGVRSDLETELNQDWSSDTAHSNTGLHQLVEQLAWTWLRSSERTFGLPALL